MVNFGVQKACQCYYNFWNSKEIARQRKEYPIIAATTTVLVAGGLTTASFVAGLISMPIALIVTATATLAITMFVKMVTEFVIRYDSISYGISCAQSNIAGIMTLVLVQAGMTAGLFGFYKVYYK